MEDESLIVITLSKEKHCFLGDDHDDKLIRLVQCGLWCEKGDDNDYFCINTKNESSLSFLSASSGVWTVDIIYEVNMGTTH